MLPLDSNMSNILAFWPCCSPLTLLVCPPPPPTLPLHKIIQTLATPCPSLTSRTHRCTSFLHLSVRTLSWDAGRGDIKSTDVGDYTWKPWLLPSISCGALCKFPALSGPQFPQFARNKELDWVTAPQCFRVSRAQDQSYTAGASASRDSQETPWDGNEARPGPSRAWPDSLGGHRDWAGTAAREAGETHSEQHSPLARAAPSGRNPPASPNPQTPPWRNHVMAARLSAQPPGPPPRACRELQFTCAVCPPPPPAPSRGLRLAGSSLAFKYRQKWVCGNLQPHFNPSLSSSEWECLVSPGGVHIFHRSSYEIM